MNKILFLIPHPDDEIVGSCKIIKNFQNKKKKIFILFLTNGVIDKNTMWSWDRKKYDHSLNTRLNEMSTLMAQERGAESFCPPKMYCVDNGTMIAMLGYVEVNSGRTTSLADSEINPLMRTDSTPILWA